MVDEETKNLIQEMHDNIREIRDWVIRCNPQNGYQAGLVMRDINESHNKIYKQAKEIIQRIGGEL